MNILDKYRESCLLYVKIDFGFLAAFGTAISLFKLERQEILDIFDSFQTVLFFILILLLFSLVIERFIVLDMKSDESKIKAKVFGTYGWLLRIQLILHVAVFSFICGNTVEAKDIYFTYRAQEEIVEDIKKSVTKYMDRHQKMPQNRNEFILEFPIVPTFTSDTNKLQFDYKLIDSANYLIQMPGIDWKLNTEDDWTRKVYIIYGYK